MWCEWSVVTFISSTMFLMRNSPQPRGWGLFLIEKMVDEAHVTSEDGRRTLELVLRLKGDGNADT